MKPTDLKFPFKWEERSPLIRDGVLFIPWHYFSHDSWVHPGWDDPALFGKKGPISVEFCSGNGTWIAEKARENPDWLWIAVERRFDRVRKIWSKKKNYSLSNLIVVAGQAEDFIEHYLKEDSVDAVYINFPDPWPKNKHAKNRLLQKPFAEKLARVVKKGGDACFVTDDAPYCQQMIAVMRETVGWTSLHPDPFYITQLEGYGASYFDDLWRAKGREIHYLQFINKKGY